MKKKAKGQNVNLATSPSSTTPTNQGATALMCTSAAVLRSRAKYQSYLWYWGSPFNDSSSHLYFCREHWWKPDPENVPHDAALYELLRRNPIIGKIHFPPYPFTPILTIPVHSVATSIVPYCMRHWLNLSSKEQADFRYHLTQDYPGKGRDLTTGVEELTKRLRLCSRLNFGRSQGETIGLLAERAAEDGRLVLAIKTDFRSEKDAKAALKQISRILRLCWRKRKVAARARSQTWLPAIEEFENEYESNGDSYFKLGYSKAFKKFKAHIDQVFV